MLKKFIFFLAWIGIFLLSIVGINFVILPDKYIFSSQILTRLSLFELKIIILSISILYFFIVIYKFFTLFERNKDYEKATENGVIKISNASINNYVLELLKKDSTLGSVKVNSEKKGKKFYIYIKLEILEQLNVTEKILEIQNSVKENLAKNIGIEVKDVVINIAGLSTEGISKTEVK